MSRRPEPAVEGTAAVARFCAVTEDWNAVQPHLRPEEHVLWVGRPDPAVRLTGRDAFLIPFSVLWCGFVLVWEVLAVASGAPVFFWLWGLPFVLIGLYLLIGRFVVKSRRKRATVYAVTDQRALILSGARSLTDAPLADQPVSTRTARDGRHATAVIGAGGLGAGLGGWPGMYGNTGLEPFQRGMSGQLGFFDVADGAAMLAALDRARAGTPGG
jgi:hypothetical protein